MTKHRNPRPKVPKRPTPDNLDPGILTALLYDDLVEVEALATTADSMVSQLPPMPQGRYGRILARLYTLVGATATRAAEALDRGEELVAVRKAQLVVAQVAETAKRSAAGRAR